jgi:tetratricopeptide (TPR) repeat protein
VLFLVVALGCSARSAREGPGAIDRMNEDKTTAHDLLENGRFQDVVEILDPWAEQTVQDPQVYSMLANAQWKLKAYDEAIGNYEKALRLDYSDAHAHLELAQLLVEIGRRGRAVTEFDLAIQYGGRDPLAHYNYGLALYGWNQREEALGQWKTAYSLDMRDPRYAEAVGIGLTGKDDTTALEYFERADSLDADHASFRNNFGLLLQRLGDYTRAESEFKNAVAQEPGNASYRRNLALLYMVSGQMSAAAPVWETLLGEDADNRTYRIYLARAYLGSDRFESAIGVLEDWLRGVGGGTEETGPAGADTGEAPSLDEAYEVLAMSYRGEKDLGRAAYYLRRALELKPNSVVYLIDYGVILAEDGKIPEARAQWEKALRIDPGNATARQNLSAYER